MSSVTRPASAARAVYTAIPGGLPFEQALLLLQPELYRFARSLVGDPVTADDLVQETVTRAIANKDRFCEGTNLRAWTFTILRNFHFAQWHKLKRFSEWDPGLDEDLNASGGQEAAVALSQLYDEFTQLPRLQREALALVAVAGCTYEEAADLRNCPVGTMKSRVSRARAALESGRAQRGFCTSDGFEAFLDLSRSLLGAIEGAPALACADTDDDCTECAPGVGGRREERREREAAPSGG